MEDRRLLSTGPLPVRLQACKSFGDWADESLADKGVAAKDTDEIVGNLNFGNYAPIDFGDAPDPAYPTLAINQGAGHVLLEHGPLMGATVDPDPDGQPDPSAFGDDGDGSDDEDGVAFTTPLIASGPPVGVDVDLSASPVDGYLNAWIDFNADGDWDDPDEHVFHDVLLTAGTVHGLSFSVPEIAAFGTTFARFRLSSEIGLSYAGLALDGEVEDYCVEIACIPGTIEGTQWNDLDGDGDWDANEPGLANRQVYVDYDHNGQWDPEEPDAWTDADGRYTITDVCPRTRAVAVVPQADWEQTFPARVSGTGELTYVEHVVDGQGGLNGARSVVVSPNGAHLYVASFEGVSVFRRDVATSELNLVQLFTSAAEATSLTISPEGTHLYAVRGSRNEVVIAQCDPLTGALDYAGRISSGWLPDFQHPTSVALSPDGNHLYVTAYDNDAVFVFSREPLTGGVDLVQTVQEGQNGVRWLDGAGWVTVSPDGQYVYAGAYLDDSLVGFRRDPATGELAYIHSLRGIDGLNQIRRVTVSPDGNHIYTIGRQNNSLGVFQRYPVNDFVEFVQVIRNGEDGVEGLGGVNSIVVSRDGNHIYVTAEYSDAVTAFRRDATTGRLSFLQVLSEDSGGIDTLDSVQSIAISPDDGYVFTVAYADDTLTTFGRDAVTGELQYLDHIENIKGLNGARSVSTSPDGAHVYVAGRSDNAVAVFRRAASTGAVSFVEAVRDGLNGVDGLERVYAVTVSPDGRHVYTAAAGEDAVAVFTRDEATGRLGFVQVLRDGENGVDGLDAPYSVAVSPDGNHVYTAARDDDAVAVFRRDAATGQLSFLQVLKDGLDGADGLNYACWVTVSPEGSHVYVTGRQDDAVAVFARDAATGQLSPVQVLFDGQEGVMGLDGAHSIAVTRDGRHAYVAGSYSGRVAAFRRDRTTGRLSFIQEIGRLDRPYSVAVSPDGDHVYVADSGDDAAAAFARNPATGELSFLQLIEDGAGGVDGLAEAKSVLVCPDGNHVYVTGEYDDALVVFDRDGGRTGFHVVELAPGGSVENVVFGHHAEIDFGDVPDPTYSTLAIRGGAGHVLKENGPFLGATVDADPDGQPSAAADGDDRLDGNDDEDGVRLTAPLIPGQPAAVDVDMLASPSEGSFSGWIDFNADGDWADPGEQIFADELLAPGTIHALGFAVPEAASPGPTYARFRLSTSSGLSYDGLAPDGEVEDYRVVVITVPAQVVGQYVFYNNSAFDGNDGAANEADDGAIAPDKVALLSGETATFANYTSYARGINAIMVDIAGLAAAPTLEDLGFKVGNDDDPSGWSDAPAPAEIAVRWGEGAGGSDRVTIIWPDNVIQKRWLQVTVLPGGNTGLDRADVFYFGNAIGESGNSATDAKVNAYDMLGARDNQRTFVNPAAVDFNYDYNRDARVNAYDMLIARDNQTHFLNALKLITVPGGKAGENVAKLENRLASWHESWPAGDGVLMQAPGRRSRAAGASPRELDWLCEFEQTDVTRPDSEEGRTKDNLPIWQTY